MYVFQDLNTTIFSQIYQLVKERPLNYWGGRLKFYPKIALVGPIDGKEDL